MELLQELPHIMVFIILYTILAQRQITDLDLKYKDKINMYHVLNSEKNDLLQLLLPTAYQVKILRANIYYLKIYEMIIVK